MAQKITIIQPGKIKEKYLQKAQEEYLKRINIYTKIEIKETKEHKITKQNKANIKQLQKKEAEEIEKQIKSNSYIIVLDEHGQQETSKSLAKIINTNQSKNITFIIGGYSGIDNTIKTKANKILSLSNLTFPHELTRILLLEQIYRAYTIINNKKYHY